MIYPFYIHSVTVRPEDIDELGHANNVCYVRWMQDAAIGHSTVNGWPSQQYRDFGSAWVARRHTVEYLLPAYAGDELFVKTAICDFKSVRSTRRYVFIRKNDDAVLARAETLWAFISLANGRPRKIPQEVASCFTVFQLDQANHRDCLFPAT